MCFHVYFDTNAYNRVADQFSVSEIKNLRETLDGRGWSLCLSPVNIIEFLQNAHCSRREELVSVAQNLCDSRLLVEPEALVVNFIVGKTLDDRVSDMALSSLFSESDLAATWRDISLHPCKTFYFNREDLRRFDLSRSLHAFFHAHFSRGENLSSVCRGLSVSDSDIEVMLRAATEDRRRMSVPSERVPSICQHTRLLVAAVFCVGCTPFPTAVDRYWQRIGVTDSSKRIHETSDRLSFVYEEGPIRAMGALMAWQTTKKYNAGNFFDCYHMVYLPHVDVFVTDDEGFHSFQSAFPDAESLRCLRTLEVFLAELDSEKSSA